jgi:hypothetical protein
MGLGIAVAGADPMALEPQAVNKSAHNVNVIHLRIRRLMGCSPLVPPRQGLRTVREHQWCSEESVPNLGSEAQLQPAQAPVQAPVQWANEGLVSLKDPCHAVHMQIVLAVSLLPAQPLQEFRAT